MSKVHIPEVLPPESKEKRALSVPGTLPTGAANDSLAGKVQQAAWSAFRTGASNERVAELNEAARLVRGQHDDETIIEATEALEAMIALFTDGNKKQKRKRREQP